MHQSPELQNCIDLCQSCAATCLLTVTHCLEKGGPHSKRTRPADGVVTRQRHSSSRSAAHAPGNSSSMALAG
jgi:hypothetical protein